MKPGKFDYFAPTSVAEALDNVKQAGYSGKVLAGGQSLIPAMNFRMALPSALVDLNGVSELFYIKPGNDNGIIIGAMTRDSTVEHDKLVAERAPLIKEAMPFIAHPQIRNRGTFGGAIAHADPTGQLPAVTLALNARYHLRNKQKDRWVAADDFFTGPFSTEIQPDELLIEVAIPPMPQRSGYSYKQMSRQSGSQALVGVTVYTLLDDKGRCKDVRLALLSVGEKPFLAAQACKMLIGQAPTAEAIQAAADTASTTDIDPGGDIHCTAEYRRHLVNVLSRQALTEAFDRASKKRG